MRRFIVTIGLLLVLGILAATLVLFNGQQSALPAPTPAPPVALTVPAVQPSPTLPQPPSPQAVAPVATIPARGPCSPPTGWARYIIFPGDTAEQLARRTGTPLDHILRANGCRSASDFYAGDEIFLPRRPAPRQEGVVAGGSETLPPDSPPPHAQPATAREGIQPTRFAAPPAAGAAATPTPTQPEALGHAPQPSATSTATETLPGALTVALSPEGKLTIRVTPSILKIGGQLRVCMETKDVADSVPIRAKATAGTKELWSTSVLASQMPRCELVSTAEWPSGPISVALSAENARSVSQTIQLHAGIGESAMSHPYSETQSASAATTITVTFSLTNGAASSAAAATNGITASTEAHPDTTTTTAPITVEGHVPGAVKEPESPSQTLTATTPEALPSAEGPEAAPESGTQAETPNPAQITAETTGTTASPEITLQPDSTPNNAALIEATPSSTVTPEPAPGADEALPTGQTTITPTPPATQTSLSLSVTATPSQPPSPLLTSP
ncbi:MAG: hypothetical protein KJZ93_03060 [Caldilineaceae bacterium]|nr:hypothetical protein [Caldilineaceae bacterium]